jgi:hypothetical protein
MKGLVIVFALLIGGFIYALSHFDKVAAPIINHVIQQEGDIPVMKDAAQHSIDQSDQVFSNKYAPLLHQRFILARIAVVLDDGYVLDLAKDSMDRYLDTPLQHSQDLGYLMFHRAQILDQTGQYEAAWKGYVQYFNLVPDGEDYAVARSAAAKLVASHGFY